MIQHMQRQHDKQHTTYLWQQLQLQCQYSIEHIIKGKFNCFPVEGCTGGSKYCTKFYCHFCLRHPDDDIITKEDGLLDKWSICVIQCLNLQQHQGLQTCKKEAQWHTHKQLQQAQVDAESVTFTVNGKHIEPVREFRYLG